MTWFYSFKTNNNIFIFHCVQATQNPACCLSPEQATAVKPLASPISRLRSTRKSGQILRWNFKISRYHCSTGGENMQPFKPSLGHFSGFKICSFQRLHDIVDCQMPNAKLAISVYIETLFKFLLSFFPSFAVITRIFSCVIMRWLPLLAKGLLQSHCEAAPASPVAKYAWFFWLSKPLPSEVVQTVESLKGCL